MTGDFRTDSKIIDNQKRNHRIRDRHFAVDILSSAAGGAFVMAIAEKSWICAILTLVLVGAVFVFDRIGIEEEENIEKD